MITELKTDYPNDSFVKSLYINLKKVKYNFNEIAFYYIKSLFSAGHIATVRSESQNNVFKTGFQDQLSKNNLEQTVVHLESLAMASDLKALNELKSYLI